MNMLVDYPNAMVALETANQLLKLANNAIEAGEDVSDEELDAALSRVDEANEDWESALEEGGESDGGD